MAQITQICATCRAGALLKLRALTKNRGAMGSAIAGDYQEAARLEIDASRCDDRF
jgi:hypothetical protein